MSTDLSGGLREPALTVLRGSFRGELVAPGHQAYEQLRRVWNGSIDRRPALIARCAEVADVSAAVRLARDSGLAAAVRSGGHRFPGLSVADGAVVIDLRLMNEIRLEPKTR